MLDKIEISEGSLGEVDNEKAIVMLVDLLYSFHYEIRMLGFADEVSSESSKNII